MLSQGDKTGNECVLDELKAFIKQRDGKPGNVYLGLPHRLDRPVSGAILLAKTSKALSRLSQNFRDNTMKKIYWAITESAPDPPQGVLEDWLWKDRKINKSYRVKSDRAGAKKACLKYITLGSSRRYYLIQVQLLTGRHHQIRTQLSGIGCPVKGDLKYGAKRSNPDGCICLHARSLELSHPVSGELLNIQAPVPEGALWQLFGPTNEDGSVFSKQR